MSRDEINELLNIVECRKRKLDKIYEEEHAIDGFNSLLKYNPDLEIFKGKIKKWENIEDVQDEHYPKITRGLIIHFKPKNTESVRIEVTDYYNDGCNVSYYFNGCENVEDAMMNIDEISEMKNNLLAMDIEPNKENIKKYIKLINLDRDYLYDFNIGVDYNRL